MNNKLGEFMKKDYKKKYQLNKNTDLTGKYLTSITNPTVQPDCTENGQQGIYTTATTRKHAVRKFRRPL